MFVVLIALKNYILKIQQQQVFLETMFWLRQGHISLLFDQMAPKQGYGVEILVW